MEVQGAGARQATWPPTRVTPAAISTRTERSAPEPNQRSLPLAAKDVASWHNISTLDTLCHPPVRVTGHEVLACRRRSTFRLREHGMRLVGDPNET